MIDMSAEAEIISAALPTPSQPVLLLLIAVCVGIIVYLNKKGI